MMDILIALVSALNAISALQSDSLAGFVLALGGLLFDLVMIIIDLF